MHRYEPRPIRFHGLRAVGGWRLKQYSIVYGDAQVGWEAFEPATTLVAASLPQPPVTPERAGVGFIIAHRGRTALYCVLGWWDNENELPVRVFVRELDGDDAWRPARPTESFCVWDLQVIGFEREAYVATMLAGGDVDRATRAYLSAALTSVGAASPVAAGAGGA